jgi:hypothetical protein
MDRLLFRAKLVAMSIHLLCSLVLVLIGLAVLSMWYPAWLFSSDGGLKVFWMLLGVDMVLGPLMTFVLYNPSKSIKERVLDLSIVAILQLSAFGYGMHLAWQQRPQALVYVDNAVVSCPHQWFVLAKQAAPKTDLLDLQSLTLQPTPAEIGDRFMLALNAGVGECVFTQQYRPLVDAKKVITAQRADLLKQLPVDAQKHIQPNQMLVQFDGRYQSLILVMNADLKQVLMSYKLPKKAQK